MTMAPLAFAQAEPTPADVESAKIAFTEGLALREKGDEAGALVKFRAAYALVPTPITGVEVGRSLVATGHVLEGRSLLLDVSRMPKKAGESEHAEASRAEAADLAEKAKAKLATLTVETDADANIAIDDASIPKDASQAPRVLDPGHHVVVVHSHGKSGRAEVDLQPGEQHHVRVDADHDDAPTKTALKFHLGTPFWVSVVVAGVGLVTGVATGAAALSVTGHLASECPNKTCPQSAWGDLDTSLALGWTSTIGFIAGGAGAITAIVLFATSGRREPEAQARVPWVRVGLGSVAVGGSF